VVSPEAAPEARISLVQGDITCQKVDAIVNAANESLAPGGGVCGAIHAAGGPEIAQACEHIGFCATGSAVTTTAGTLPARWVIHAVGPVWSDKPAEDCELLASAYHAAVRRAAEAGARSLAVPAISTGIYGFPVEKAAPVAIRALREAQVEHPEVDDIRVVLFDDATFAAFERAAAG
jgi:O-acetyl-ADP-ribose deacetylase (regulator of RNase III)